MRSAVELGTHGGCLLESALVDRCWACDGPRFAPSFSAREMMFGLREEFEYHECVACGSLQIAKIPSDLGRHYPSGYCSFSVPDAPSSVIEDALKPVRRMLYSRRLLSEPLHRIEEGFVPCPIRTVIGILLPDLQVVHQMNVLRAGPDTAILDVGSGAGSLLRTLKSLGFTRLMGVDPFIEEGIEEAGMRILKTDLFGVEGRFDVIIFNHSLEHMSDPVRALRRARDMLTTDGRCMVRLPVTGSYAWQRYRENWFQLDPPRHLMVPSVAGFHRLADRAGLAILRTEFDSTGLQFAASELYLRDVPFIDHFGGGARTEFTEKELKVFAARATRLNSEGKGDQAAFYLKKAARTG